jgi:hypothetical protein
MKSKTLKQFLAEKRKLDVQRAEAVMDTLDKLTHVNDNSYCGSAVIINITDLEGKVLADAAINGEFFDALRPHLVEAYRQTLADKETFAVCKVRKMQNLITSLDPERSK